MQLQLQSCWVSSKTTKSAKFVEMQSRAAFYGILGGHLIWAPFRNFGLKSATYFRQQFCVPWQKQ